MANGNLALKLTIQADGTALVQATQQGVRGLKDVGDQAVQAGGHLKKLGDSSRSVSGLADSVSTLRSAVASIAVGALARNFVQTADAVTGLRSKLGLVTSSVTELVALEKSLFDISQQSRGSYTALGQTYAQVARSTENLGISQTQLLALTKSIAQAITISGGSATSANAALVQLSQGFASGTLRGEELNSVMEQTPRLAQAIADGLGISIGQLRAMGQAGELTAEKVVRALEKASASLESEFSRVATTAEQGFTVAANSVTVLVDRINTATGATSLLASGLGVFAKAVDFIAGDIEKLNTQGQIRAAADDVLRLDARATKLRNGLANGFFGAEFRGDLERTLTDLDAAKKRFNELDSPAAASPSESFRRSEIKDQEVQVRRLSAAQQAAQDVIRELSGVNKDYQKDLSTLHEAYKNGTLDINAYRDAVSELAKKNSKLDEQQAKSAAEAKAIAEGRFAVTKAVAEQVAEIERNTLALFSKANEAAYAKGTLDATAYYTERARLLTADLDLQEKALTAELVAAQVAADSASKAEDKARAQARVVEITTKLIELGRERLQVDGPEEIATREWEAYAAAAEKRYQVAADGADALTTELRNLEQEGALIGQTEEAVRALLLARAEQAAQELERQALVARGIDLDGVAAQKLQDQADMTRRIAQQRNNNAVAQQTADVAERIESTFRGSFLRLTEAGKSKWKAFTQGLYATFKTEVADQIYKTFLKPFVVKVIGNFLGIEGGVANAAINAASGGSITGLAQNASTLNTLYGVGSQFLTGSAVGASAASLGFANIVGAVGGDALGALIAANGGYAGVAVGSAAGAGAAAGGAAAGGAAGGGSLYASAAAAGPYVVAALAVLNALGVFRSKKIVDGGLQGELGGQVNDYALQRKGGTLFSGPSYRVLDQGASVQNQALQDSYNAIRNSVAGMAEQLGVGNDAIKAFTVRLGNDLIHPDTGGFGIKTQGLTQEEIIAKIEAALVSANEQLAAFALGTTQYTRNGETAVQTLGRLTGSLQTLNGSFDLLGFKVVDASLANADAASQFLDSFGGIEGYLQASSSFYQNYFSETERTAQLTEQLTEQFAALGFTLPTSRNGLRDLVQQQASLGAGALPTVAKLLQLEGAFASITPPAEALFKTIAEATDLFVQAQERVAAANTEVASTLEALQQYGDGLQADVANTLDSINQLRQQAVSAVSEAAQANQSALQTLQTYADSLASQVAQANASINDIRQQAAQAVTAAEQDRATAISTLASFGTSLASSIESSRSSINQLRQQAAQQEAQALQGVVQAIGALRSQATADAGALQQAQAQVTSAGQAVTAAIAGVANVLTAAGQEVASAQAAITQDYLRALGEVASARQAVTSAYEQAVQDNKAVRDAIAADLGSAQDAYAAAQQRVIDLQREAGTSLRSFATDIQAYLRGLQASDLGANNPLNRPDAARAQFEQLASQAANGDQAARGQLTAAADILLRSISEFGTSFDELQVADIRIRQVLNGLAGSALVQAGPAAPVVAATDPQEEAAQALAAALARLESIQAIATAAGVTATQSTRDLGAEYTASAAALAQATANVLTSGASFSAQQPDVLAAYLSAAVGLADAEARVTASGAARSVAEGDLLAAYTAGNAKLTAAQAAYDAIVANASASGFDTAVRNTTDALAGALAALTQAQAGVGAANDALAVAQSQSASSAAAYNAAIEQARALNITIADDQAALLTLVAKIASSTQALTEARALALALEAEKATADSGIVAQYEALTSTLAEQVAQQDAFTARVAASNIDLSQAQGSVNGFDALVARVITSQTALDAAIAVATTVQANKASADIGLVAQYTTLTATLQRLDVEQAALINGARAAGVSIIFNADQLAGGLSAAANGVNVSAASIGAGAGSLAASLNAGVVSFDAAGNAIVTGANGLVQSLNGGMVSIDAAGNAIVTGANGILFSLIEGATGMDASLVNLGEGVDTATSLLQRLGVAQVDLLTAQQAAAEVRAELLTEEASLVEQYADLQVQLEAQTTALEDFQARVNGIDFSPLDALDPLGDLLTQYAGAVSELLSAQQGQATANAELGEALAREYFSQIKDFDQSAFVAQGKALDKEGGATAEQVNTLYQQLLGRGIGDASLASAIAGYIDAGQQTFAGLSADIRASAEFLARSYGVDVQGSFNSEVGRLISGVPGFASGGDFGGGIRLVGERGMELESTGPSRIFSAGQTSNILGGAAAGSAEMLAELKALRRDIATLIAKNSSENRGMQLNLLDINDRLRQWNIDGLPEERAEAVA